MSYELDVDSLTLVAAADLSAKQFYAVKVDSAGKAALCSAAGEFAIGILLNKPESGKQAAVAYGGVTKAIAGGTITAGATVKVDSAGKLVDAAEAVTNTSDAGSTTDPLIGSNVVGVALAGAVSGDIFPVLLTMSGATPTTAA